MNYRHAYHAGNHADVLKHVCLTRILVHLSAKETPFAVLDAHAGIGVYDLSGVEAGKTFEWEAGIGRLAAPFTPEVEALLQPYRANCLRAKQQQFAAKDKENSSKSEQDLQGTKRFYAGSPMLSARLSRPQDTLYFNELHPEDKVLLEDCFTCDSRVKTFSMDASRAVKSILPFSCGRGLVLIDPPFEKTDEIQQVEAQLREGLRRMAHATFAIWYPIKDYEVSRALAACAKTLKSENILQTELLVKQPAPQHLAGSGLLVINPPWKLKDELEILVPALAKRLGTEKWGRGTVNWIAPPK